MTRPRIGNRKSAREAIRGRLWLAAVVGLPLLGLAVTATAFWPGIMIDDARWQYQQAVDNAYEDWHPPLMAWIWRRLMFIQPGPGPMLLLQLLLYWGGIALIALWAYRQRRPRLAFALALAGWLPAPLALMGTVLKDCLMAGLLTSGTGLMLWRAVPRARVRRRILTAASLALFVLAAAMRFNAFLACAPLVLCLAPKVLRSTSFRLAATGIAAALALALIVPAVSAILQAEKTDVTQSLIVFDLGGMTEHSGVDLFPDMHVRNPVEANHRCYDSFEWDSYSDWAPRPCPLGFDQFQATVDQTGLNPVAWWLRAIAHHPLAYAEHRLAHFNRSIWFLVPSGPDFTAWTNSVPNPWGFAVRPNPLLQTISAFADSAAKTPFGWPVFWLAVAAAVMILGLSAGLSAEIIALAASAFLYGAGFLVFGVATGMRYYVWTIVAAGLAAVMAAAGLRSARARPGARTILCALAIVLIPCLMAIAARLA